MLEALLILASLYLPGHFLGNSLARKGDGWTELILLRVASSAAVAGPVLILAALTGYFTTLVLAASFLFCAVLAFLFGRKRAIIVRLGRWDLLALGLVAGSFALYARPAEYVVNLRDPGVYAVIADKMARTGALLHRDPLLGAVASFHAFAEGKKYPGFYIYGQDLIVPQFFPGPFAFLGLGNLAGDLWGSLYVAPVFGALSVGMAFVLGRELFGRRAGLLGAALLAVGFAQVWWTRQPSSEIMAQFFVVSGLLLIARFARTGERKTGVLAGTLLGGAMLIRVDAFLAALAVPLLFGYNLFTRRPARRWLLPGIPLAAFAGASLLYLNTVGGRYLYLIYEGHGLDKILGWSPYLLGAAALVIATFWGVRARRGERLGGWLAVRGRDLALVGALFVVAGALWAYFVMPVPWESLPVASRDFDVYGSQILVRLVWFVTPPVGLLALAGLTLAAYRLDAARAIFLGAVLGFGILYTVMPNVSPDLPWATRRFVPAVLPGVCLLAGFAAVEAGGALGRLWDRRAGVVLTGALAALALGWTIQVALPIMGARELGGAVDAFERVNRSIPEARVVYVEGPDGSDPGASTLEYVYGRPVLPYDRVRFLREKDELREVGLLRDAVYVTTDGGPAPLVSDLEFRQVAREEISLPLLLPTEGHENELSTEFGAFQKTYRIYRVEED